MFRRMGHVIEGHVMIDTHHVMHESKIRHPKVNQGNKLVIHLLSPGALEPRALYTFLAIPHRQIRATKGVDDVTDESQGLAAEIIQMQIVGGKHGQGHMFRTQAKVILNIPRGLHHMFNGLNSMGIFLN